MKDVVLVLVLMIMSFSCYADQSLDILLIPNEDGTVAFFYKNEIVPTYDFLMEILKLRNDPFISSRIGDHQFNKTLFSISFVIGCSSFIIWMINEVANTDFSSPDPKDQIWKYSLIGSTVLGLGLAFLFDKAAGSDIMKAIEFYNRSNMTQ